MVSENAVYRGTARFGIYSPHREASQLNEANLQKIDEQYSPKNKLLDFNHIDQNSIGEYTFSFADSVP